MNQKHQKILEENENDKDDEDASRLSNFIQGKVMPFEDIEDPSLIDILPEKVGDSYSYDTLPGKVGDLYSFDDKTELPSYIEGETELPPEIEEIIKNPNFISDRTILKKLEY